MAEPCYAWTLAHDNRADAGHDLALGQVPMANNALMAGLGLEFGMAAKELGDLGLDGLGQKGVRPAA